MKDYTAAQQRAAKAQQRDLSLYAFERFCMAQRSRIIGGFVGDPHISDEQAEAQWRRTRLGGSLVTDRVYGIDPETINVEVRK